MNSKRVKKTNAKESRQKELHEILSLYDFIAPRKELKELYEQGVNEFVNGVLCFPFIQIFKFFICKIYIPPSSSNSCYWEKIIPTCTCR
jgi:hypothetical protein